MSSHVAYQALISVDVQFTNHAIKRARRRFGLASTNEARSFILRELQHAYSSSVSRDNCTAWETPQSVVVTRSTHDGLLVLTCYPNDVTERRNAPRRNARMSTPRYRERRRAIKQQVHHEVQHILNGAW